MSDMDAQQRMSRQIDRNTERIDNHAAVIADLAARMHITEHQAERLWAQLSKMEESAQVRQREVLDAIHDVKTDGRILSTRFELRSKLAGKIAAGAALLLAAVWTLWQLAEAAITLIKGA